MPLMTLTQFRNTRQPCDDLGAALAEDWFDGKVAGFIYVSDTYIERTDTGYRLQLLRQTHDSHTLEPLEAMLHAWCLDECAEDMRVP